jgi:hypothetical protein
MINKAAISVAPAEYRCCQIKKPVWQGGLFAFQVLSTCGNGDVILYDLG